MGQGEIPRVGDGDWGLLNEFIIQFNGPQWPPLELGLHCFVTTVSVEVQKGHFLGRDRAWAEHGATAGLSATGELFRAWQGDNPLEVYR